MITHPYLMGFCFCFLLVSLLFFNRAREMQRRSKQFVIRFPREDGE